MSHFIKNENVRFTFDAIINALDGIHNDYKQVVFILLTHKSKFPKKIKKCLKIYLVINCLIIGKIDEITSAHAIATSQCSF